MFCLEGTREGGRRRQLRRLTREDLCFFIEPNPISKFGHATDMQKLGSCPGLKPGPTIVTLCHYCVQCEKLFGSPGSFITRGFPRRKFVRITQARWTVVFHESMNKVRPANQAWAVASPVECESHRPVPSIALPVTRSNQQTDKCFPLDPQLGHARLFLGMPLVLGSVVGR